MRSFIVGLMAVVCSTVAYCEDQEETIVTTRTGVLSKFIDRSVVRNTDPVTTSDIRIEHKNFGLEFKGVVDLTDINENGGDFTDIDLQFDYTFHFKKFVVQLGFVYYAYPNSSNDSTEELFTKISYDLGWGLTPYAKVSYDIDEVNGIYSEVGVDHVFDLSDKVKFGPITSAKVKSGANIGYATDKYNKYYFNHKDNGFDMTKVNTGIEFGIKSWTITPGVEYYYMLDDTANSSLDQWGDGFVYGINLGYKF